MAIVTSGPYVGFSGTVDGITYYPLPDGRTCAKRKNPKRTKPATPDQIIVEQDTRLFASFMRPFQDFAQIGFEQEAKKLRMNVNNAMVKCNRKNTLQGEYPNRSINYSKVLVTKGSLPGAHAAAQMTDKGLVYTWATSSNSAIAHHTDQVIMLAYFPDLKETRYLAGGTQRSSGEALLVLDGIKRGYQAEVYISFVSDDRKNISDSMHLGQFIWYSNDPLNAGRADIANPSTGEIFEIKPLENAAAMAAGAAEVTNYVTKANLYCAGNLSGGVQSWTLGLNFVPVILPLSTLQDIEGTPDKPG